MRCSAAISPSAPRRGRRRGRDGAGRPGVPVMSRWELTTLERVGEHPPGPRRLRLRAGAGAGQRRGARQHRRRRARAVHRAGGGRPDGRDAGRHLGADHDRAAALLRGAGRRPHRPRGVRRQEPLRGVHAAAQGGRDRPGADGLHRRRPLRGGGRGAGPGAVQDRRHRGLAAGDLLRSAG